jgi:hypothetical protein
MIARPDRFRDVGDHLSLLRWTEEFWRRRIERRWPRLTNGKRFWSETRR